MQPSSCNGGFRGGEPAPSPLGRRTDAVTVLLISDNCKTCTSEYSKWLSPVALECIEFILGRGSAVGAYSAPQTP